MPAEQLYYSHPDKFLFNAEVTGLLQETDLLRTDAAGMISSLKNEKTNEVYGILLNRTLCYPGGGGQPADRGVLETREAEVLTAELLTTLFCSHTGDIIHLTDRPVKPGTAIRGTLDRALRQDFQQQHSAQHLISAALFRKMKHDTLAIHLGESQSTIEFSSTRFSDFDSSLLEKECSALIHRALPLTSFEADRSNLEPGSLRREPEVDHEVIRLLAVGDYDLAPCGGVHCTNSAQVGPVFITGSEKTSKGTKLFFVAGDRASALFHRRKKLVERLVKEFSAPEVQLDEAFSAHLKRLSVLKSTQESLMREISSSVCSGIKKEAPQLVDLRHLERDTAQSVAATCAKRLSREEKSALLLFTGKKGSRWIMLENRDEEHCKELQNEVKRAGISGGGRYPRFEGQATEDQIAPLIRLYREAYPGQ